MQKVVFLLLIAQSFVQSFRAGNSRLPDLCRSGKFDIGFLLDISSMSSSQFKREVAIMKGIAKAFSIGLGSNRAGLVTFNNKATTVIRRGDTAARSISEFEDRVRNLRRSGRAYIERGLDKVTDSLYDPGEDIHGHRKILFVLTDGRQDRRVDLELHTQDLMQFRVKIIVIAMGPRPKSRYINALVEDTMRDIVRSRNSRTPIGKTVHDAIQAVCLKRPSPPGPSCKSKVDLAFLLDASGSIGRKNWPKEPKFVMDVLEKLGDFELADGVRAGVIIYSSKSYVNFWIKLNDFNSIAEFRKKLNSFKYIRGKATAISDALTMAKNELFQLRNGDRPDAPDTLVLITDGVQNPPLKSGDTLNNYAQPLRQAGVTTIAVGVGKANVNELQMIAGDPNRYFTLDSINDLGKAVQFVSSKVCDSCEVNIAFVLDASTTTLTYYDHEKKLVNFISTRLQVGSSESKAAVVSFSDDAKLDIGFDQYQDSLESYTIALRFLRNKRGRTNIQKGLLSAENEFKNPRTGVRLNEKLPKVIVLISDGLENEGSAAGTAARLRSEGFHIVAVSLGRPNMRLLRAITGSKKLIFDVNYRKKDEVFFNDMVGKVVLGVCKKY